MRTELKRQAIQAGKVIAIGLMLGMGINFAVADWTAPLSSAPACASGNPGCDAPVNVSDNPQVKATGSSVFTPGFTAGYALSVEKPSGVANGQSLLTDTITNVGNLYNNGAVSVWGAPQAADSANKLNVYGTGNFDVSRYSGNAGTRALLLKSNPSNGIWSNSVTIASPDASNLTIYDDTNQQPMSLRAQDGKFNGHVGVGASFNTSQSPSWRSGGVDIDLTGKASPQNRDAISVTAGDTGQDYVGLVLRNIRKLNIWSDAAGLGGGEGGLEAGSLQLTNGNPQPGSVLTASDTSGNAAWEPGTLSTVIVGNNGNFTSDAMCPAGYYAVGGGANCDRNTSSTDQTRDVEQSAPINASYSLPSNSGQSAGTDFIGWQGKCHTNGSGNSIVDVFAVCAPIPGYAAPQALAWHTVSGQGSGGQSCSAWIASAYPSASGLQAIQATGTQGSTNSALTGGTTAQPGDCAYRFTSAQSSAVGSGVLSSACVAMSSTYSNASAYPVASCSDNSATLTVPGIGTLTGVSETTQAQY